MRQRKQHRRVRQGQKEFLKNGKIVGKTEQTKKGQLVPKDNVQ